MSLFIVDATEQAVIDQFGRPVRVIINPVEGPDTEATIKSLGNIKKYQIWITIL